MKNVRVSIRLLWPHIIILLLLVAWTIFNIVSFTDIRKQAEALYNESFVVKSVVNTINEALEATQTSAYRAIINDSQSITDEVITDARNSAEMIQKQVPLIRQNTLGDTTILSKLQKYLSELTPMQEYVLELAVQNKNEEAVEYMESSIIPVIKKTQKELAQLVQSADAKEIEILASLQQKKRNAISLLIFVSVASALCSIGVGVYIWRLQKKGDRACYRLFKRHNSGV